jgi:UDP-N-acetylglucosamine/UDP-N-acetylgalactosamine 4-epimerase
MQLNFPGLGLISRHSFLVTGGAGFIGSNLVKYLLEEGALKVRVLDNLSTGFASSLDSVRNHPSLEFIEGDIRDSDTCRKACEGIDFVSHQAALGSVPRSIASPLATNDVNITGQLNMLYAAHQSGVRRLVYASSSSAYGDHPALPKKEELTGRPLSPYAVTKQVNELYAGVFSEVYKLPVVGLRYFNVFGPGQSPEGQYAAVIPLFISAVLTGRQPLIHGDGGQTRDFTYVQNVVEANIRALLHEDPAVPGQVYNIAAGERTSLNALMNLLNSIAGTSVTPLYGPARQGDIRDSLADISKASALLGYAPSVKLEEGLRITFEWFRKNHPSGL